MLVELDALVAEMNEKTAEGPTWSRSDVVRAILGRRLRERKPGETP
jgi:Arc/MetJ-type ribon-helix-helix transcriptional regulator